MGASIRPRAIHAGIGDLNALLRGKPLLSIVLVKAHHACLSHSILSRLVVSPPNYVIIFTLAGP